MQNSAHVAAAFFISDMGNNNFQPKMNEYHSHNYMELNAVAGNFWTHKQPSKAHMLAEHVKSFGNIYQPTLESMNMEAAYMLPSIARATHAMAPMYRMPSAAASAVESQMSLAGGLVGSVDNAFPGSALATLTPRAMPALKSNLLQRALFQVDPQ
jgi:hypothetical protein